MNIKKLSEAANFNNFHEFDFFRTEAKIYNVFIPLNHVLNILSGFKFFLKNNFSAHFTIAQLSSMKRKKTLRLILN